MDNILICMKIKTISKGFSWKLLNTLGSPKRSQLKKNQEQNHYPKQHKNI